MLKNYLKIALRNIIKSKGHSVINISGLTIGIAACLAIVLFLKEELSYDSYINDSEKIFRVTHKRTYPDRITYGANLPVPFAPSLDGQYAEVESILDIRPSGNRLFTIDKNNIYESNGLYASTDFFDFFNWAIIKGEPYNSLHLPRKVILTETLANKYFGDSWKNSLLDKSITIDGRHEYQLIAVIKDAPSNFHLKLDYILSKATLNNILTNRDKGNWLSPRHYVYLKLQGSQNKSGIEKQLIDFAKSNVDPITIPLGYNYNYQLQALENIHLHSSHFKYDIADRGNYTYVQTLGIIAAFILLLACANFINFSTAIANKRAKEVGLRKVSGANRSQIIFQFLGESFLIVFTALVAGSLLVEVLLPWFNSIIGKNLTFNIFEDLQLTMILLSVLFLSSILAGGYTAFYISSIQPARVLKGLTNRHSFSSLRRFLVLFQFIISMILIMGSVVIYNQLTFLQTKNIGIDQEHVVVVPIINALHSQIDVIKNDLNSDTNISSVTASYGLPGSFIQGDNIYSKETNLDLPISMYLVDKDFIPTLDIELAAGKNFSDGKFDEQYSYIINETTAKMLGYTNDEAIGKTLEWDMWLSGDTVKTGQIIGVMQDFNYQSLEKSIEPVVIHQFKQRVSHLAIRINKNNIPASLAHIEKVYSKYQPQRPFEYKFLDSYFDSFYQKEQMFATLLQVFTTLAILIACLGLLGLVAFATEQRKKEICIRKIHGANVSSILRLINGDIVKLIIIAAVIAIPLAYYLGNNWLNNYAYHIEIDWEIMMNTLLSTLSLAAVTVIYFSVKAATTNPATVLRDE